jgi:uncharacterized protein YqeY
MSLLGYTEEDIYRMMAGISIAKSYLPQNSSNDEVRKELQNAYDFLDGMLVEGRI